MTIRFFFKNPGQAKASGSPYSIYVEFHYQGLSFRMNTGIKLVYRHFKATKDPDKLVTVHYQRETKQNRAAKANEFKKIIDNIELVATKHEKGMIPDEKLELAFRNCLDNRLPVESNLLETFDEFIAYQTMKGNAKKTISVLKGTRSMLVQIMADFPDASYNVFNLGIDFFDKLRKVSVSRGFMIGTYNKYFKWVRSMMLWVVERHPNAHINMYFRNEKELRDVYKEPLFLFDEEIRTLWFMELPSISLREHRDMFIFQLLSGQRHGELASLGKSLETIDVENRIWRAYSTKTGKTQKIPLTDQMMEIYERYKKKGKFPVKSNQKRNQMIKEVFAIAGLNRPISVTHQFLGSGKPEISEMTLDKAITTHVARASLITVLSRTHQTTAIRQMTGHSSDRELNPYTGNNEEYKRTMMMDTSNLLLKK